jgi:cytosine/uracil/thiamine/allantoin permease
MFSFGDLFQWERFITPSIIKVFYWLAVAIAIVFGLSAIASGLELMLASPFLGFLTVLASVIGIVVGIVFARIVAEFVLIVFRINEHLGAIRNRDEGAL